VYESRERRDALNAKVMKDPRMANMDPKSLPVDGKRMLCARGQTPGLTPCLTPKQVERTAISRAPVALGAASIIVLYNPASDTDSADQTKGAST
jgi:hypothetical protein